MDFQYKVTVIVPVYNVAEYLKDCLDSLVAQTIDHSQMEVLLINDGSTDNSLEICYEYAQSYFMFKVFSKGNEGLSATRNYGIKRAQGKYLMFLDSDDMYTPETVKEVTDFFDTVYDQVDLVTFLDQPYRDGKKIKVHYRYNYLKKKGVYSLDEFPYICQTRVNVCVKNMGKNNFLFDTTPEFRLEDQEYCSKVLKDKRRIGFCDRGEYQYNRSNAGSIVSNYFYALYLFEPSMKYFEELFASFGTEVPPYYQVMFLNDVVWKLNEDKLLPYHYEKEDYKKAWGRIVALMEKVSCETILSYPNIDNFQKQYWLSVKKNAHPVICAEKNKVSILVDGKEAYSRKNFELIMHKIRIQKKRMKLMAFVKSPIYVHLNEKANVYVIENDNVESRRKLDTTLSVHSWYKAKEQTAKFYLFNYFCDTRVVHSIKFQVELDGITYDTSYWCMPVAVFNNKLGINSYVRDNVKITLKGNELQLGQLDDSAVEDFEQTQCERFKKQPYIYNLRKESLKYRKIHRIWLYYDLYTVKKDNGYYQFVNDFAHEDGVERYYVYDRDYSDIEELFTEKQRSYLVRFGSEKHKLLYLSAEKILTAFYGFSTVSPFKTEEEEGNYLDLIKFESIYLQHGVLHADLRLKNHAERCRADKIVVSSLFEQNNYINNYGYMREEIIPTGMARYDHICREKIPGNKILFAPSWRKYLTLEYGGSKWEVLENRIAASDYWINIMRFLNDENLLSKLEEKDLYIDFKLHPIIKDAGHLVTFDNKRIRLASEDIQVEDYQMFITDFSSYVFDFACLSRPIMYFVPDMLQFKSGMNHYRKLDLPFEKAFGKLTTNPVDASKEVIRIIDVGFVTDDIYKNRMDQFFLPLENCAEKLYQYLKKEQGE